MHGKKLCWLVGIALALAACNLSTVPPTPTVAPATATPFFFPSPTPLLDPGGTSPTITSLPEGANPNCPIPPGWITYTVEPGDSMGLLAQQTNSTIAELTQANCLDNADQIFVGQVLYLPRRPVVS